MMKIRLSSALVGHRFDKNGRHCGEFSHPAGAIVEWPATEAQRLIDRGYATKVDDTVRERR